MKMQLKKRYYKIFGTILMCICLSLFAQIIPAHAVHDNIKSSVMSFSNYAVWPEVINDYQGSKLDDFTDAIILNIAGYDGEEPLMKRMVANYRKRVGDPCEDLSVYKGNVKEKYIGEYARYWFGSIFFVKILLLFFDYSGIQMFNQIMQLFLLSYLLYLMVKQNLSTFCIPLLTSLLFLMPITISLSLQFSSVYYVTLIAMILILKNKSVQTEEKGWKITFFMCIGIVTNWLDLLTYPLLTLGMPLVLLLIISDGGNKKIRIKQIAQLAVAWGVGYGGMWLLKWAIASLVLHRNVFAEALQQILFRTSLEYNDTEFNGLQVILKNIKVMTKLPYFFLLVVVFIYAAKDVIIRMKEKEFRGKEILGSCIPYFVVSGMPFVWYYVLCNHSWIHFWFTYRILAISIFSLLVMIFQIGKNKKGKTEGDKYYG